MTAARDLPLDFRIGARTLVSLPRRLVRVAWSLEQVLAGDTPPLPPLPAAADGYSLLSVPVERLAAVRKGLPGMIVAERQRYARYHADLSRGWAACHAALSANLRSQLKRKTKKLAAANGGAVDIRRYSKPDELAAFHAIARPLAAGTYQERLLAMGLPGNPGFVADMLRRAAAGEVRAWLLFVGERAVAYLYCPVVRGDVVYEYVGHDAAYDALSPGTVLMAQALRDLCEAGGYRRFDFTEGEGQLKRQFAGGATQCVDLLALRATLANRLALRALAGWDAAVALAKRMRN